MQRRALIRYGREVELIDMRRKMRVEPQWRVADNPLLLKGIDAHAKTQRVMLSERTAVRTLAPDDLFAFLCVHGARHSVAPKMAGRSERAHRLAQSRYRAPLSARAKHREPDCAPPRRYRCASG